MVGRVAIFPTVVVDGPKPEVPRPNHTDSDHAKCGSRLYQVVTFGQLIDPDVMNARLRPTVPCTIG